MCFKKFYLIVVSKFKGKVNLLKSKRLKYLFIQVLNFRINNYGNRTIINQMYFHISSKNSCGNRFP